MFADQRNKIKMKWVVAVAHNPLAIALGVIFAVLVVTLIVIGVKHQQRKNRERENYVVSKKQDVVISNGEQGDRDDVAFVQDDNNDGGRETDGGDVHDDDEYDENDYDEDNQDVEKLPRGNVHPVENENEYPDVVDEDNDGPKVMGYNE